MLTEKDRIRLRDLAKRQLELAESERNKQLYKDWEVHGRTDASGRPMITVEFGTFCTEFVEPLLLCESDKARELERMLLRDIFPFENFGDDTIIRNYIGVSEEYRIIPFGLAALREESGGLGHHIVPQVKDLAEDFHLLGKSGIELAEGHTLGEFVDEIVGDILPVKKTGRPRYAAFMQNIVHIMGMEDMYVAMLEEAELFHEMCAMLTNDYIEAMERTESEGMLRATNGDVPLSQGSMCFSDDLPQSGDCLKTSQIWGYMDAQEAQGISPDMYHEFLFPYYKRISERFGLLSYGCCEGVDSFWDDISKFENLRKLSISPWCNEEIIGGALLGRKVVYHRKPSPNYIGVDRYLDEDAVRSHIKRTVDCASGLTLEFSQRDVYTVHCDIGKVARFVKIIREECEKKR